MICVRDVFQVRFGAAAEFTALFREFEGYGLPDGRIRVLTDADLEGVQDYSATGFGEMPTADFLAILLTHVCIHSGEISAAKGLQGHKGYPV